MYTWIDFLEEFMVKKIIVLVISLILSVGSLVSYNVINDSTVDFGAGDGVSRTISTVDDLTSLLSKIPNHGNYDESDDVSTLEGLADFKGLTVVENAEKTVYDNFRTVRLDDDPNVAPEDIIYYLQRDVEYKSQRLQMNFTKNAIYYHSIGVMYNGFEIASLIGNEYQNFDSDYFVRAERTVTEYDVEIYHSKARTMYKINTWNVYDQEATDTYAYMPNYVNVPEEEVNEDELDADEWLEYKASKIQSNHLKVWIEVDKNATDIDEEEGPSQEELENMTEEQQMQYMINYMVDMTCQQISFMQVESIGQANVANVSYLSRLANFLATNYVQDTKCFYYDEHEQLHKFLSSYENEEGDWVDTPKYDYLRNIVGYGRFPVYKADGWSQGVNLEFNLGSDICTIRQRIEAGKTFYYNEETKTTTTIMHVDNTVANLSSDSKIKPVKDVYGDDLREIYTTYFQMQGEDD